MELILIFTYMQHKLQILVNKVDVITFLYYSGNSIYMLYPLLHILLLSEFKYF